MAKKAKEHGTNSYGKDVVSSALMKSRPVSDVIFLVSHLHLLHPSLFQF